MLEVVTQQVTKVRGLQTTAAGSAGCVHLDGMTWKDIVQMIVETHNKKCAHTGVTLNHNMVGMTSSITSSNDEDVVTPKKLAKTPPVKKPDGRSLATRLATTPPKTRSRVKMRGGKVNATSRANSMAQQINARPSSMTQQINAKPSGMTQQINAKPSGLAQQTNAKPSGMAQQTNAKPSGMAQQTNAKPSGMAQQTNAKPSGIAQQINAKSNSVGQQNNSRPKSAGTQKKTNSMTNFEAEFQATVHKILTGEVDEPSASKKAPQQTEDNHVEENTSMEDGAQMNEKMQTFGDARGNLNDDDDIDIVQCTDCKRWFQSQDQLKRHSVVHATDRGPHVCEICKCPFPTEWDLQKHMPAAHKEKIQEPENVPGAPLRVRRAYKRKIKTEDEDVPVANEEGLFDCETCNSAFKTLGGLRKHRTQIHSKTIIQINKEGKIIGRPEVVESVPRPLSREIMMNMTQHWNQKCQVCKEVFRSKLQLEKHMDIHSSDKGDHLCDECGKSCRTQWNLVRHMMIHDKVKKYKCPDCDSQFGIKTKFEQHRAKVHNSGVIYTCDVDGCGAKYKNKATLKFHMLEHSGQKEFACNFCNKSFPRPNALRLHKISHKPKRFNCTLCSKAYPYRSLLVRHWQHSHWREQTIKCNYCDKTFQNYYQKHAHEETHTGKRLFPCDECGKGFHQKSSLATHQKIHTGEKPWPCGTCGKQFVTKSHAMRHEKSHQTTVSKKIFQCSFCDSEFNYKHQWQDHENRHKGIKPHKCTHCEAAFVARCDLSRHQKIHTGSATYSCAYCNMIFKQRASMEKHEMEKHLQFDTDEDETNNVVVFKLKK